MIAWLRRALPHRLFSCMAQRSLYIQQVPAQETPGVVATSTVYVQCRARIVGIRQIVCAHLPLLSAKHTTMPAVLHRVHLRHALGNASAEVASGLITRSMAVRTALLAPSADG